MSVYFVRRPCDGLVKIGFSGNPDGRIYTLKSQFPGLKVLRIADGDSRSERAVHKMFASSRVVGEWFMMDPAMLTCDVPAPVPVHPLLKWIKAEGKFIGIVASHAGISADRLAAYIKFRRPAPMPVRLAFEVVTGGAVKADDWPEASQ